MNLTSTYNTEYVRQLAEIEKFLNRDKKLLLKKYNNKIKKNWKNLSSIEDIFDLTIGCVKFYDYEWQLAENLKFKQIFESKYNNSYLYMTEDDNHKLLRGPWAYYYMVCAKDKFKPLQRGDVLNWLNNLSEFIKELNNNLGELSKISDENRKFYLAICDHVRLALTLMLNFELAKKNGGKNYIYKISNDDFAICKYSNLFTKIHSLILQTLFEKSFNINDLNLLINELIDMISISISQIETIDMTILYQSFKIHRELDCFIENYFGIKYFIQTFKKKLNDYNFVGIMNGGIELPYIIANIIGAPLDKIYFINLNNNKLYLERHTDIDANQVVDNRSIKTDNYILLDDNALTGRTIEKASNFLSNNNTVYTALIRHPNINRVEQSKVYNRTLNLSLFKEKYYGMLFDSPFSKLKADTNWGNEYLDEFGTFTKSGEAFLRCLYRNQMFKVNSEVSQLKGFVEEGIWKEQK